MRRILHKYKAFRKNCALFFREDSERIWKGNWAFIRHMSLLYMLCLISYGLYVLIIGGVPMKAEILHTAIGIHGAFMAVRFLWRSQPKPGVIGAFIGFFGFEILALSLMMGIYIMSDQIAFLFPLTLILMTEIYTLPPEYVAGGVAGFSVLFLALSASLKSPGIFQMDVLGVIVADFIGGVGYATLNIYKVESFMARRELIHISRSDSLTGLSNRHAYAEMLDAHRRRPVKDVGAAFLDVNGLKYINDNMGHKKGDDIIKRTAAMLERHFDKSSIYRISGDEFEVIAAGVSQADFERAIAGVNRDPEMTDNHIASMGVAWHGNCRDLVRLTDEAEKAMYISKQNFYINNRGKRHVNLGLVKNFARQLVSGGLTFCLRPRVRLSDGAICGAVALVKAPDGNGETALMGNYYKLLEDAYLISKLDFYKAERACETLLRWEAEGRGDMVIAMRISRVTLMEDGCASRLAALFESRGINRKRLEIELDEAEGETERLSLEKSIALLAGMGLRITVLSENSDRASMTPFMTPGVSQIVIGGELAAKITQSDRARQMTGEIIGMCHRMGMDCLARGVETDKQKETLKELGCDSIEGSAAGEPVPAAGFTGK